MSEESERQKRLLEILQREHPRELERAMLILMVEDLQAENEQLKQALMLTAAAAPV
jgi:hypothetical protein